MCNLCDCQVLAGLRSEKQSLESSLYETQQLNAQLDSLKQQLECENRQLLVKKDNLQGQSPVRYIVLQYTGCNRSVYSTAALNH